MNREKYILEKYQIDTTQKAPYFIHCNRWKQFPYLLSELEVKVGVEIGVEKGKFADSLLRKIPDLKLYGVDCWETSKEYRKTFIDRTVQYEKEAREVLAKHGDRSVLIKKYSLDAVKDFEDESLDFIFIDGNHDFQNVTNDIVEWSKKVKKGGIISGHDYVMANPGYERIDVKNVVDAYTDAYGIGTWFVLEQTANYPSWLWIKQ